MKNLQTEVTVLWVRVLGLATLHGAIAVTWLVYNLYLPELLAQFSFPLTLIPLILILENLLAAVVEPAAGAASDQTAKRWYGRFSLISGGVITAAAIFVIIPLIAIISPPTGIGRWLLPALLILWALAMATFRSPSLTLLKRTASNTNLPQAAAILTIITALFAAIRPFSTNFILGLGPLAAFAIGSGGLLISTVVLRQTFTNDQPPTPPPSTKPFNLQTLNSFRFQLALIFVLGLGGGLSLNFSRPAVSNILQVQFPAQNTTWMLALFFFLLACLALPLAIVATKTGNRRTMTSGTAAAVIGLTIASVSTSTIIWPLTLLLLLIGLSTLLTGALPFALDLIPSRWSGLSIGIHFSGFTLATSIFHALPTDSASLTTITILAALSFALSWLCVTLAPNPESP